jgi:P2-related tail formation protein
MANILASGIANKEHLAAFDKIADARFLELEIDKVLIYLIDIVDTDALLSLAEQFDLMGYKGWLLATTEAEKRSLIKRAIELHRYKGTPYGIKEALRLVGFDNTVIQERIGDLYDGSLDHDGAVNYGGGNWATFRIIFDLGNDKGINSTQTTNLLGLIDEFKNVRSEFLGYSWRASLDDTFVLGEDFQMTIIYAQDTDTPFEGVAYNGTANYNGSNIHKNRPDTLDVVELP